MRLTKYLSLAAILSLSGCIMPPKSYHVSAAQAGRNHAVKTGEFWWGTSTSSFQNEDRGEKPGSPNYFLTDWDLFAEEGRAAVKGDAGTYSWTDFDKDVAALKKIGVSHFRFSIEWARVEPQPGRFNEAAIRHYAEMARKLKAAGIEPIVTLWHFTFPSWMYDKEKKDKVNFLYPGVEDYWKAYVTQMAQALKPYVRYYVPQNEPNGALQLGWVAGHWPPGLLLSPFKFKKANKICAEMFCEAAHIIKAERPDAVIMSVHSLPHWRPQFWGDPTFMTYNTMMRQNFDNLDAIQDCVDVIGINYYYSQDATIRTFLTHGQGEKASNYTQMGWKIEPEGIYTVIKQIGDRYQKPMFISENGIGTKSEQKKIKYLRDHINQVRRAAAEGYDIRGYFAWTLVDNFEWTEGYVPNFGLTVMDPKTKDRVFEPSALFFQNVIRSAKMKPAIHQ
jgi:beta-glucosidase